MRRALLLATALGTVLHPAIVPAQAPDRLRASTYSDTPRDCEPWDVGFEYRECQKVRFPGDEAEWVQVYTREDGSRESFIENPRANATPTAGSAPAAPVGGRPGLVVTTAPGGGGAPAQMPEPQQQTAVPDTLPSDITVFPGRTELLPVAVGHLNRLQTPFAQPALRTSASDSAFNVEFDGSYVYVSATQPVTMFIHEKGHPDPAIGVSLIPRRIAPRQVSLSLPPAQLRQADANRASLVRSQTPELPLQNTRIGSRYQSGIPHVQRISTVLQTFGQGEIPRGFRKGSGGFNGDDLCRTNVGVNFSFRTGQKYYDAEYVVLIGRATSDRRRTLQEVWCAAHPATAAVSFYPRPVISKGKPTEVLIVLKRETGRGNVRTRDVLVTR